MVRIILTDCRRLCPCHVITADVGRDSLPVGDPMGDSLSSVILATINESRHHRCGSLSDAI